MYWEEEYEEDIPIIGFITMDSTVSYFEDREVTIRLNMDLNQWEKLSRSKTWKRLCKMFEDGAAQVKKRRIGF